MTTWPSLFRVRFGLWVAGLVLAALAAFGTVVYFSLERGLLAAVDDSLRLSASQTLAVVETEDGQLSFGDSVPPAGGFAERDMTLRVLGPDGRVEQGVGEFKDWPVNRASLAAARQGQSTFETVPATSAGNLIRFHTTPIVRQGRFLGAVQLALGLGDVQLTLRRLLQALLLGGPVLVVLPRL